MLVRKQNLLKLRPIHGVSELKICMHNEEKKIILWQAYDKRRTVDFCYLEFKGTIWNTSRYPYLEISELQKWGKQ